jgi:hypothetical protein
MRSLRTIVAMGGAAGLAPMVVPTSADAGDVSVTVYGPRPVVAPAPRVYVAPASTVYVAPAGVVTVGPNCATRTVRAWIGNRYVYRTVRRCY